MDSQLSNSFVLLAVGRECLIGQFGLPVLPSVGDGLEESGLNSSFLNNGQSFFFFFHYREDITAWKIPIGAPYSQYVTLWEILHNDVQALSFPSCHPMEESPL